MDVEEHCFFFFACELIIKFGKSFVISQQCKRESNENKQLKSDWKIEKF
jgi:hypothetical protein